MLITELWNGQGLGNQLHCYVTTRAISKKLGYEFGIHHPERFKGSSFLNLDFGNKVEGGLTTIEGKPPSLLPNSIKNYFVEKNIRDGFGNDVSPYDWTILNIKDDTKIDGLFQGEDYFIEYRNEIREWLKVKTIPMPDNHCIINFRGGEYKYVPQFFLRSKYWDDAISNMLKIRNDMVFSVVTDDVDCAKLFFNKYGFSISHDMANDYISIQSAKYLILSNSSFAFYPAWLNQNVETVIAPRYWGRHNVSDGYWSIDQNYTKGWMYQDRDGNLGEEK